MFFCFCFGQGTHVLGPRVRERRCRCARQCHLCAFSKRQYRDDFCRSFIAQRVDHWLFRRRGLAFRLDDLLAPCRPRFCNDFACVRLGYTTGTIPNCFLLQGQHRNRGTRVGQRLECQHHVSSVLDRFYRHFCWRNHLGTCRCKHQAKYAKKKKKKNLHCRVLNWFSGSCKLLY